MVALACASLLAVVTTSPASVAASGAVVQQPLSARTLDTIGSRFRRLMDLANRHDIDAIDAMFWQSPSALLVAKSANPSEGNWAGFWATRRSIKSCTTSPRPVRSSSSQIYRN